MFFWLYLYPASIFGGILYSTSVAGWESYALFMWCAIPLHFFITQFAPSTPLGTWGRIDTAGVVWLAAFGLGTYLVWGVVGEPLQASWLGWLLKGFLIFSAVVWGLFAMSSLAALSVRALAYIAPNAGVTDAILNSIVRWEARQGNVLTIDEVLPASLAARRARRLAVNH